MEDVIHLSATIYKHFYSIQGEGPQCGSPAVFLRLAGCPLNCSYCDSKELWQKGEAFSIDAIDEILESNGYYFQLRKGAHLVITGGDPMLQQAAILNLFKRLAEFERNPERIFVEVETQGTVEPKPEMFGLVRQWNISPKLSNSGVPLEKRIVTSVLQKYASSNACFKFPVKDYADLKEVDEIVKAAKIRRSRVYLMPICDTRGTFYAPAAKVAEMCKNSGYKFGNRLHLILWDNAPGH